MLNCDWKFSNFFETVPTIYNWFIFWRMKLPRNLASPIIIILTSNFMSNLIFRKLSIQFFAFERTALEIEFFDITFPTNPFAPLLLPLPLTQTALPPPPLKSQIQRWHQNILISLRLFRPRFRSIFKVTILYGLLLLQWFF